MPLRFREGVHWCVANGRIVLLDLKADQYSCLPDDAERACQKLLQGLPLDAGDRAALADMPDVCLSDAPGNGPHAPQLPSAARSLLDDADQRSDYPASLSAVWDQVRIGALLRLTSLFDLIERTRAQKPPSGAQELSQPIQKDIFRFMASRRLLSRQSQCLRTSLALIDYLARRGYFPNLVIGVRRAPFAAHAWVQDGDTVLNDTVDEVAPYTPILVV